MPRVLIERADGGVSIMHVPDPQTDVANEVARWEAGSGYGPAVGWYLIQDADLPASRRWRNAWRRNGNAITHHLPTARQLRRAELLADREQRLTRVRRKEQEAREDGQNALAAQLRDRAKALRQIEAQVDTDLAGIADLAGLEAYQPAAFGQAD